MTSKNGERSMRIDHTKVVNHWQGRENKLYAGNPIYDSLPNRNFRVVKEEENYTKEEVANGLKEWRERCLKSL